MASQDEQLKQTAMPTPQPPASPRETQVLLDNLGSGILCLFLANLVVAAPLLASVT